MRKALRFPWNDNQNQFKPVFSNLNLNFPNFFNNHENRGIIESSHLLKRIKSKSNKFYKCNCFHSWTVSLIGLSLVRLTTKHYHHFSLNTKIADLSRILIQIKSFQFCFNYSICNNYFNSSWLDDSVNKSDERFKRFIGRFLFSKA